MPHKRPPYDVHSAMARGECPYVEGSSLDQCSVPREDGNRQAVSSTGKAGEDCEPYQEAMAVSQRGRKPEVVRITMNVVRTPMTPSREAARRDALEAMLMAITAV